MQHRLVAHTNLFSYTFPDQPFVNHHWGSGVIFYAIERALGFDGLSLIYIALNLATFLIFLAVATKYSSFTLAAPLAVVAIPVLITRDEVRPELFSYVFGGVFLAILWGYQRDRFGLGWLLLLPVLEGVWVNLHIYFFLGILLIGVFLFEATVKYFFERSPRNRNRLLGLAGAGLLAALSSCINPAGIGGDVGGYLIYYLYPPHRVFVENRPETYPAAFFNDVYFPLQRDESQWLKFSDQFGFNVIVFNHRDRSSLGEQFIIRRVLDPAWAPVFFDGHIMILLKRFGPNQSTIAKYELPKEKILAPAG